MLVNTVGSGAGLIHCCGGPLFSLCDLSVPQPIHRQSGGNRTSAGCCEDPVNSLLERAWNQVCAQQLVIVRRKRGQGMCVPSPPPSQLLFAADAPTCT